MKIKDIVKTENLIKINHTETLSSALNKLSSSHDTAFVFGDHDKFLGIINPYYCLIKTSYPANTKVEHCLHHPPKVKINFPISKVAQLMIESKVHYLPVFDDRDRFNGIISARRLFGAMADLSVFKVPIYDVLRAKKRPVICINEEDFIANALNLFKQYKISKLVVVDKEGKLRGVLSYYDLISFLISPKLREQKSERNADKVNLTHQKVKNFTKSLVLTLGDRNPMSDVLNLILEKKIGSVVIVDQGRKPIGIITSRDLLNLLIRGTERKNIEIVSKDLSEKNRRLLGGFFARVSLWLKKAPDLIKAKVIVKEEKQGGLFEVILSLIPKKGPPKVIKKEGKNLLKVLKKIKKE